MITNVSDENTYFNSHVEKNYTNDDDIKEIDLIPANKHGMGDVYMGFKGDREDDVVVDNSLPDEAFGMKKGEKNHKTEVLKKIDIDKSSVETVVTNVISYDIEVGFQNDIVSSDKVVINISRLTGNKYTIRQEYVDGKGYKIFIGPFSSYNSALSTSISINEIDLPASIVVSNN